MMVTPKKEYISAYSKPQNLGSEASKMWDQVMTTFELRVDECRILSDACREIDIVNRIERDLKEAPAMVKGSMGQEVSNPLFTEIRQHRSTLAGLFKSLGLEKKKPAAKKGEKTNKDHVVTSIQKWKQAK